jgi:hypothetical protein
MGIDGVGQGKPEVVGGWVGEGGGGGCKDTWPNHMRQGPAASL